VLLICASAIAVVAVLVIEGRQGGTIIVRGAIDPHGPKTPLPQHFLGVSLEYRDVLPSIGTPASTGGPDQVFARLLRNLGDAGNGAPVIRLGGATQDAAWWNPDARPRPPGITFDIKPAFVKALGAFQALTGSPLIIGLNMAAGDPRIAASWARAALARLRQPAISALEVGNEPYLYPVAFSGRPPVRPAGWGVSEYVAEFARYARLLDRIRPSPPLAAPVPCCAPGWTAAAPSFLAEEASRLALASYHSYPFCTTAPQPPEAILRPAVNERALQELRPLAAASQHAGIGLRVTETDPNACSGDSRYSTALWAVDWLFALAAHGVRGVSFHQIETSPFSVVYRDGLYSGSVSPLYYAMLLFSRAAPAGSSLLLHAPSASSPHDTNVALWATVDRGGTVRVVAINKEPSQSGDAVVRVRGAGAAGQLIRLRGPSLRAATGVTLGGREIPIGTTTGVLGGVPIAETVRPDGDTYRFSLPAASAALLTVPAGH
jgi:hypothetical protein